MSKDYRHNKDELLDHMDDREFGQNYKLSPNSSQKQRRKQQQRKTREYRE